MYELYKNIHVLLGISENLLCWNEDMYDDEKKPNNKANIKAVKLITQVAFSVWFCWKCTDGGNFVWRVSSVKS